MSAQRHRDDAPPLAGCEGGSPAEGVPRDAPPGGTLLPAGRATLDVSVAKRLAAFPLEVAFRAAPGITVLFGDSGSGKTMTLRMIAGLLRPDGGHVRLGEQALYEAGPPRRWVRPQDRRLGFIFQHESLLPHLDVRANVEFGGRGQSRAERRTRAEAWLAKLRLSELAARRPAELSGGQKQRAVLARSLMQEPRALLADEPFSALDLPSRKAARECLSTVMREQGVPVVLVTHDLVEALTLADHLVVLASGRVAQQGPPRDLVAHPADDHVAALLDPAHLRVPWLSP